MQDEMKRHNVKHYCVMEQFEDSAVGRLNRDIILALAAYERENTLLRTKLGRRARVEIKGKCLNGNKAKYGFEFSSDKSKRILNEKESEVVVDIFAMRANRVSVNGIATVLNEHNIPSPNGKKWGNITVLRILRDGKYWYRGIGVAFASKTTREYRDGKVIRVRHKSSEDEIIFLPDGSIPRIISEELYLKVVEVDGAVKQDSVKANKDPESTLLRCGFIKCGVCGSAMRVHNKKENGKIIPRYICSRKGCPSSTLVTITASKTDQPVWDYVLTIVKDANVVCEAVSKLVGDNTIEKLEVSTKASIGECDRKLEKYWKDYDKEEDDEFRAALKIKIKEQMNLKKVMEKDLAKINSMAIDQNAIEAKIVEFVKWCERVRCGENEEVEYGDKRDRLRFLGIQVLVYPETDTEHERFEITTRPHELIEALESTQIKEHTSDCVLKIHCEAISSGDGIEEEL
jgi:site-specific DNA recombinase